MPEIDVSVITVVKNGERFIEACVESVAAVAALGLDRLEHLVVDGASADKTVEILQRLAEKHPHLRWISQQDSGQSDAMNTAVTMARGRILSFCNVDDFYHPQAIHRALTLFEQHPECSFVIGNCAVIKDDERVSSISKPQHLHWFSTLANSPRVQWPINPTSYFYLKDVHTRAGIYDVNEHYSMDIGFLVNALQTERICYVDEHFGNMRVIEGTKTYGAIERGEVPSNTERALKNCRRRLSLPLRFAVGIAATYYRMQKNLLRAGRGIRQIVYGNGASR